MEHRWGERIKVDIPVQIAVQPLIFRAARLLNLSLSGAGLRTGFDLRPLSRIDVVIAAPHQQNNLLEPDLLAGIAAYVTRCTPHGIGVEWCDYAPDAISDLFQSINPGRAGRLRTLQRPARRLDLLFLDNDI